MLTNTNQHAKIAQTFPLILGSISPSTFLVPVPTNVQWHSHQKLGRRGNCAPVHVKSGLTFFASGKTRHIGKSSALFPVDLHLYGYGSIPIDTIFSGMNIHFNPAILMWTTGVPGFHPHMYFMVFPSRVLKKVEPGNLSHEIISVLNVLGEVHLQFRFPHDHSAFPGSGFHPWWFSHWIYCDAHLPE